MPCCRSCNQEIEWIKTVAGKNMPVDPDLIAYADAEPGTVLVTRGGNVVVVEAGRSFPSVKGYISHFASCPYADRHRKRGE